MHFRPIGLLAELGFPAFAVKFSLLVISGAHGQIADNFRVAHSYI
jgi:hypothetical protein